jgi:hypothetical protein
MVLTASAASASRPFGITPQGARGESRKRLSPFLVQICCSRFFLYSPSAQWAFSVIGGITRPVTLSAARVACEFGSAAYSAAMVGIDEHLREVLARHRVDTGLFSPVRGVQPLIEPVIQTWGGPFIVDIRTSGSFAKGTAVHGGTDIDLFVSLTSTLTDTLQRISDTLFNAFLQAGYAPRRQNVSTGLTVNGWKVDVTPARRQDQYGNYHSLWSTKTGSWLQTNISEHIRVVSNSGRLDEIRLIKIWRNHFGIDWQSFYLELFVLDALRGARVGNVQENIVTVFRAITTSLANKRLVDPANTNNVVSNVLTADAKGAVIKSAQVALESPWNVVFQ